jgi:hypothetical protein
MLPNTPHHRYYRAKKGPALSAISSVQAVIPLGAATDAASVHEVDLGPAALADIPVTVAVPWAVPVLGDNR